MASSVASDSHQKIPNGVENGGTTPKTISLLFAGDIMAHQAISDTSYNSETNTYDYNPIFRYVKRRLSNADYIIGNLECVVSPKEGSAGWVKWHFSMWVPPAFVEALRNAGFNVLVTANNHANDLGKAGVTETIETLDQNGIRHTGTYINEEARRRQSPLILEKDGFRVGLLAFTRHTPSMLQMEEPTKMDFLEEDAIREAVERAKTMNVDQIIAFVHWGKEYQEHPDYYRQKLWFELFKELGVNIVIGSHPHVLQPMAWDKRENSLVVYSLGNFLADHKLPMLSTKGSALFRLVLEKRPDGKVQIKTAEYELLFLQKRTVDEAVKAFTIFPVKEFENKPEYFEDIFTKNEFIIRSAKDMRRLMAAENVDVYEAGTDGHYGAEYLMYDEKYSFIEPHIEVPPVRICPSQSSKRTFKRPKLE